MSKQEIQHGANADAVDHSPPRRPLLGDHSLKIAGKLGLEGETFINDSHTKSIQEDLKQALHIKNFIHESILKLERQFGADRDGLLGEFCDDQHIFQELENRNQLDIKGSLTRLLAQLSQGISLFPPTRPPNGRGRLDGAVRDADPLLPAGGALQGGVHEHLQDGQAVGPIPLPHEDAGARGGAAGFLQE